MPEFDSEGRVRAGGGVVWRERSAEGADGGGGVEVLLVHRPKYGDWTLPKGKAEAGETGDVCALREVEEETGFACDLGPALPDAEYVDHNGRPKKVRYWAMTVASGAFAPNNEVDEIRWLAPPDARALLSYSHDHVVLDALEPAISGRCS